MYHVNVALNKKVYAEMPNGLGSKGSADPTKKVVEALILRNKT